ncbi:hypothetical protein OYC64_005659 [Pagothenia borchgrevinki]|uniref:Uncharacterized protein n=1 Tax=Pagothenia borchgrevinki TaxID=8213 RepID=A0ABD2GGL5_PAGBO
MGKEEENIEEISISPAFSDPSGHITESEILDQTLAYLDDLMNHDDLMKDKEVTSPWSYSTMSDDSMGDTWCFDNDSDISDMIAPVDRDLNKVISEVCHCYLFPEDLETEADGFEETDKPLQDTDPANTLEVPEPSKQVEIPELTKNLEVSEPHQTLEVTEPFNTMEVPESPKNLEVSEPHQTLEVTESTKTLEEEENMEEISISPAFSDPSGHITESEILDQTLAYLDDLMNRDDLMKDKEVTSPWSYSTMSDDSMGDTWCFDNDSDISDMIAPVDRDLNKVISEVCHSYLFPEDLETEADGFEETDKPLQDTDPANTLEVPEPSKQVEIPELTKNPDVPEPPQNLEVTESPKTLEVPEPPKRLEVTESTKTLKVTELTKILEVPESPKTLEVTEPTMILELAELPMQVEVPEPTKNLEVSEPHQTLEVTEPFNAMEVPESPKNLEVSEPHQTLEVTESTKTLEEEENMEEISISPAFSDPSGHITESEIIEQTLAYLYDLMNRDDLMKDKEVTSPWSYSTMSDDSMGDTWCFDNDSDISDMIAPVDQDLNKVITEVCHGYLFPEDLETEADGFEETDKPLQDTDPANTLEVREPTKNPDVPEPPQTLEVTESPKTLEVPEPPKRWRSLSLQRH